MLAQDKEREKPMITLQCAYCGSSEVKLPIDTHTDDLEKMTIKCKCGKWLIRNGIMGHKNNDY